MGDSGGLNSAAQLFYFTRVDRGVGRTSSSVALRVFHTDGQGCPSYEMPHFSPREIEPQLPQAALRFFGCRSIEDGHVKNVSHEDCILFAALRRGSSCEHEGASAMSLR